MRENFGRNLGEQLSEIVQEDLGSSPSSTLRRDLWGPKGKGVNGWDRPCQGPPHAHGLSITLGFWTSPDLLVDSVDG